MVPMRVLCCVCGRADQTLTALVIPPRPTRGFYLTLQQILVVREVGLFVEHSTLASFACSLCLDFVGCADRRANVRNWGFL